MTRGGLPGQLFGQHHRELSAGGFAVRLSRATIPKEELPEHIHDEGQIILAIDPGYLSRAFAADELGRGLDLLYNPPGTVHRDCFRETGGRFLSVSVPVVFAPKQADPVRIDGYVSKRTAAHLVSLCAAARPEGEMELEAAVFDLLAQATSARPPAKAPSWLPLAQEVIASEALNQRASVGAIARAIGVHPVYFARAFRAAIGHGPAKAIMLHRTAVAAAMLPLDRGLAEIATDCGFSDQSHLCRSMRQLFGAPPSIVRAAFR